jgi:hypothetical protein
VTIEDTENDNNTNNTVPRHVPVHNHLDPLFPFIARDVGCEYETCLSQAG